MAIILGGAMTNFTDSKSINEKISTLEVLLLNILDKRDPLWIIASKLHNRLQFLLRIKDLERPKGIDLLKIRQMILVEETMKAYKEQCNKKIPVLD